jgi:hypothetical protein
VEKQSKTTYWLVINGTETPEMSHDSAVKLFELMSESPKLNVELVTHTVSKMVEPTEPKKINRDETVFGAYELGELL